jgi:hypothetical protein
LWRYAQAGDLPGNGVTIDGPLLEELVAANTGRNVIAFTHKPVLGDDPVVVQNRRLLAAAINAGFAINLSADNAAHADKLAELGIAPVVTVLARAYARRVRHRFKRRPDQWAETIGEWRDRTVSLPRHTPAQGANCGLPRNVFGRDLQELRRMRPGSGCRYRLSSPRRLAASRGRDGCPRCPSWRKLDFRRPSNNGRGDRRRSSLAYNPCQQQLAGALAFFELGSNMDDAESPLAARLGFQVVPNRHEMTSSAVIPPCAP